MTIFIRQWGNIMNRKTLYIIGRAMLAITAILFLLSIYFIFFDRGEIQTYAEIDHGSLDLTKYDLNEQILNLSNEWDYYPYQLLTSKDFVTSEPEKKDPAKNTENVTYGTFRLVMNGEPNQYYMMSGYSIDYGTKIFVNGSEVLEIGKVADNAQEAVGCANTMIFPVSTDQNGKCELIFQFSNFVHNEGGVQHNYLLSSTENIIDEQNNEEISTDLISCGLILLGAYYLLHASFKLDRTSLCLSLCCFTLSIRNIRFFLGQLLPLNYYWNIGYRIVVIDLIWIAAAMLELMNSIFPGIINKWVHRAFLAAVGISTVVMFLVRSQDCVAMNYKSVIYLAAYLIYFIFCLIRHFIKAKKLTRTDIFTLIGFGILFGAELLEAFYVRRSTEVTHGGYSALAMVAFIMIMMAVTALKERETEVALAQTRQQMKSLEQIDHMKTEFFRNMAHEIRTPLAVTSGYAQRTKHRLEKGINDETNIENLNLIQSESERLADMVNQLLRLSLGTENVENYVRVDVTQLMMDAAAVCRPLLAKNNNLLEVECEDEIFVRSNHNYIMQVMINLASNANRYTKEGTVSFNVVKDSSGMAVFRVSDTGCGIQPEILEHVFENGVSWNGEHGRGLTISKEIVEKNGGRIQVEKTGPEGTVMKFTIPLWKDEKKTEDQKHGADTAD